jgi:hypothetical protein
MRKVLLGSVFFIVGAGSAFAAGSVPTLATGVVKGQKASVAQAAPSVSVGSGEVVFVPVAPCRLVDTRPEAANAKLMSGVAVAFHAIGSNFSVQGGSPTGCGVSADAKAIAVNFTMLNTTASGDVRMWATNQAMPFAGVGVFNPPGEAVYSGGSSIVPLCQSGCPSTGEFQIYPDNSDLDIVVNVTGYFHAATSTTGAGQGLNWGTISRNTIGSATAQLRNDGSAPSGTGALQLTVGAGTDKIAFGNEVDFAGQSLSALTAVSYYVKTFDENSSGHPNGNMPALYIEINPNDGHASYSTLNYTPTVNAQGNTWSFVDAFNDTTGSWGLTGGYYNANPNATCGLNGTRCTLAQIKTMLPNATILSVAIGKGRDYAWVGEVDSLRINGTTYNFEAQGVVSVPTP